MKGPLGQNLGKIRSGPYRPSRRRLPDKTAEADVHDAQVGLALAAAPGAPKGAAPLQSIVALQKLVGNKAGGTALRDVHRRRRSGAGAARPAGRCSRAGRGDRGRAEVMGIDRTEIASSQADGPLQEGTLPERPAFEPPGPGADIVMIGDSVTGPEAGDPKLGRIEHVRAAEQRFAVEGFTKDQTAAIEQATTEGVRNGLRRMSYGERIDTFVKETLLGDPALGHLRVSERYQPGPDFFDSATGRWYDLTTTGEWADHVARYGTSGTATHVPTGR